jgi:hypothetical protein
MTTYVEAENEKQAVEIAKKSEEWNFDNYFEEHFDHEIDYTYDTEEGAYD